MTLCHARDDRAMCFATLLLSPSEGEEGRNDPVLIVFMSKVVGDGVCVILSHTYGGGR